MAGTHPDEVTLLDFVEGDLADRERAELSAHLDACPACAETVRLLEAGRAALRDSGLLAFPAGEREAIMAQLPPREPAPRFHFSARRLVAVLAPVAAAAAVIGILVTTNPTVGDGGGDQAAELEGEADVAEDAGAEAGAEEPGERALAGGEPVRSVDGPPAQVAALLRERGFDARVANGRVEVAGADPAALERALAGRPDGSVPVVLVP